MTGGGGVAYTITKDFAFSASHVLDGLPDGHQCARLHGHNYAVRVELTGPLDSRGFVFDYGDLAAFKVWLKGTVDHRHLNDVLAVGPNLTNPTAENLSRYLTASLHAVVALPASVLARVWVSETPETWAVWTP